MVAPNSPEVVAESAPTPEGRELPQPARQIFPEDKSQLYISVIQRDKHKEPERVEIPAHAHEAVRPETSLFADSLQLAPVTASKKPALQVYHEVHSSVIRLQRFTRGYLVRLSVFLGTRSVYKALTRILRAQTRRRFFLMLEDLVMKSSGACNHTSHSHS